MYVLRLNFSSINISNFEEFNRSLTLEINNSINMMKGIYEILSNFCIEKDYTITLQNLAAKIQSKKSSLLILIDEYDSSITKFFNKPEEIEKFKEEALSHLEDFLQN